MLHVINPWTAQDTAHRHQNDPGRQDTKTKTVRTEQPGSQEVSDQAEGNTDTQQTGGIDLLYPEDPRLQAFLSVAGWTCIFVSIFCLLPPIVLLRYIHVSTQEEKAQVSTAAPALNVYREPPPLKPKTVLVPNYSKVS